MERKRRSGSVPQLGRIALKRVPVPANSEFALEDTAEISDEDALADLEALLEQVAEEHQRNKQPPESPATAPEPARPAIMRRAIVVESDGPVREAVAACLPSDVFETHAFEAPDAALELFTAKGAALAIIGRELRGASGAVLCKLMRRTPHGGAVGIVLMSPAYRDGQLGGRETTAFGADAFLPLPATARVLAERVEQALCLREPIERLEVMPAEVARAIDSRFQRHDKQNYYELLEVDRVATAPEIQKSYHRIARWLHPDRHARLRKTHPHVYERINTLYKRLGEAYAVLVDDDRRRSYNLGLHKRGTLRLDLSRTSRREERELSLCQTDEARSHVLESLEARSLGDLEWAEESMQRAVQSEPDNPSLALVLDSIRKLLDIVRRSRA